MLEAFSSSEHPLRGVSFLLGISSLWAFPSGILGHLRPLGIVSFHRESFPSSRNLHPLGIPLGNPLGIVGES